MAKMTPQQRVEAWITAEGRTRFTNAMNALLHGATNYDLERLFAIDEMTARVYRKCLNGNLAQIDAPGAKGAGHREAYNRATPAWRVDLYTRAAKMRLSGMQINDIAAAMRIDRQHVYRAFDWWNRSHPEQPVEINHFERYSRTPEAETIKLYTDVVKLRKSGMPIADIADELHISRDRVYTALRWWNEVHPDESIRINSFKKGRGRV